MKKWLKWWLFGGVIGFVISELFVFLAPCLWGLIKFRIWEGCTYNLIWQGYGVLVPFLIGAMLGIIIFWIKEKIK